MSLNKITFQNNVIVFDQEHAKNIFGLFQRLHDRTKYAGTGLGLAICKKIVENYGGEITAEGKQGIGARFVIYLPVSGATDPVSRDNPGVLTGLSKLNDYI